MYTYFSLAHESKFGSGLIILELGEPTASPEALMWPQKTLLPVLQAIIVSFLAIDYFRSRLNCPT